jgi:hypothetical protein
VTGNQEEIAREQAELSADLQRIFAWGNEHPDAFGGAWYDNEEGMERIGMAVVGGKQPSLLLEHPDRVTFVPVTRSEQQLRDLADRIVRETMPSDQSKTYVSAVGPNIRTNKVTVGISDADDAFVATLLERYGPEQIEIETGLVPKTLS